MTTRWVTDAGAGDGLGGDEANAMSFTNFTDYMVTGGSFTAAPGDVFNIIGNITSRTTTTDTWVNGGNSTSPVVVRGVVSGGATAYAGRTNGNGPLITTNFPQITYTTGRLTTTGLSFILIENLNITSASTSAAGTVLIGADSVLKSCKVANTGTNNATRAVTAAAGAIVFDCDISISGAIAAPTGGAVDIVALGTRLDSCRIIVTNSTAPAVNCNLSTTIYGNTIYGSGGVGIQTITTSARPFIRNNTIVGCTGDGINILTGTTLLQTIIGNMITDNTGGGIDMVSTSNAAFTAYNRFRDNAAAYQNAGDWITSTSYGDVTTDTGGPETDYVNAGSNDYRLIFASPAINVGQPLYSAIGALQRIQSTSGGGMRLAGHGGLAA